MWIIANCRNCGCEFTSLRSTHVHCSLRCRVENSVKVREAKTRTCSKCKTEFKSVSKNKYCSRKCQFDKGQRDCVTCGKKYKAKQENQIYCSRNCNPYKTSKKDAFYHSKEWRSIRSEFLKGFKIVNGVMLSNKYCKDCFEKHGELTPMFALDHIKRRNEGGGENDENLQSLCQHHHQSKSAKEGNKIRRCQDQNMNHYHTSKKEVERYSIRL